MLTANHAAVRRRNTQVCVQINTSIESTVLETSVAFFCDFGSFSDLLLSSY